MKNSIGVLFAILAGAGLLAACNNGTIAAPPGTGSNCGGPPNQLEVLYPAPGARNVSDALGNIFVSTSGNLPPNNQFNFLLSQSNGASTFTSLFQGTSASQIPTPHATPSYSNPTYYVTSLPASYIIGPSQTVNVYWNDGGTGCTPHFLVSSFKTK